MLRKTIYISAMALSIATLFSSCSTQKTVGTSYTPVSKTELEGTALFVEASRERQKGNDSLAIVKYKEALEKNSSDAASMYELSRLYQKQEGMNTQALQMAQKAVKLDPDNQWYLMQLADVYKQKEQYNELVSIYQKLIVLDSSNPDLYNDLAVAYLLLGDNQKAIDVYNMLEKEIGVNEFVTLRKAKVYEYEEKPEKALEEYEKLAEAHPYEIRNYQILAEYASSLKKYEIALKAYDKIKELNPDDPYVHISLADYYKKLGKDKESFEQLKEGFANPSLDAKTKIQLMVAYYTQDQIMGSALKEATQLAKEIASSDPKNPLAWSFYGNFLFQTKETDSAFIAYRKAMELGDKTYATAEAMLFSMNMSYAKADSITKEVVELFPTYPIPYLYRGLILSRDKDYKDAISTLRKGQMLVVKNPPLKAEFYSLLGDAYHSTGRNEDAYASYDKALEIKYDNSVVLNNYAYYLSLEKKNLEKAKEMSAKAVELDPDNASNLDTYAWVLFELGEYDSAKKYILMAVANGGDKSATVLEHCGDIYYKLGDTVIALQYWKKALKEGGDSPLLERKIKEKKYIDN